MRMAADAERFAQTVEPGERYPEDLVVERVTRFRPERTTLGAAVDGAELLADLAALVLRLTRRDPTDAAERGGALMLVDVARALGVSRRTMERFRAAGLVLHHVRGVDGRVRVACYPDALEAFRARSGARIERAGRTMRLDGPARSALCDSALSALEAGALARPTLQSLALRASGERGCSVRTARTVLEGDARVVAALAAARGTVGRGPRRRGRRSDESLAARALGMGASPARIGAWLGLPQARALRAAIRGRVSALGALHSEIAAEPLPVFAMPDAAASILGPTVVRRGLSVAVPSEAMLSLIHI